MSCRPGEGTTHHFACDCREEAFRKLVEAAKEFYLQEGFGPHHHQGVPVKCPECNLAEALKFYATPGHSPEGKTL